MILSRIISLTASTPCILALIRLLLRLIILESSCNFNLTKVCSFTYGVNLETDLLRFLILLLLLYVVIVIIVITNKKTPTRNKIQLLLLLVLITVFTVKNLITFYVMFEVSLIPVGLIIIREGYQPERFLATSYIFIYTIRSSIPLLVLLLTWIYYKILLLSNLPWSSLTGICPKSLFFLAVIASFIVKLPVYGVHLWLPKAHVEAPLEGSVILAGLMLKLGGFGIVYLIPFRQNLLGYGNLYISAFRGLGGVAIRVLCVRITDLKILIAYSSVSHIALVCIALFRASKTLIIGRVLIMLSHGLSRPGMFTGAYIIYKYRNSRNLLLNGGNTIFLPYFRF